MTAAGLSEQVRKVKCVVKSRRPKYRAPEGINLSQVHKRL